ncbi:MAG: hypothetical protein Q9227_000155 [Pyrenula ochraceoflavens]
MGEPVSINVEASNHQGMLPPFSRFFGADEPNYATHPHGKDLLSEMGKLGTGPSYFRTHNLLTTGDGTPALKFGSTNAYTESSDGTPIYNFTILDQIFDTYLSRNVKPYAQIGFMPKALSTHPDPYFFTFTPTSPYYIIYTGWSYPPTSYQKWGDLVFEWVSHCISRYGVEEVNSWYWEVWNEPNIQYWNGTVSEFYALHDHAVAAVRRALPTARVGGAEVAGGPDGSYLGNFLQHTISGNNSATGGIGSPLDFVSFHAKGSPSYVNATSATPGHVLMGLSAQLQNIRDAFSVISSFPDYKDKPIVIGECDPDGCAACITPQYGYRNGLLYPSFIAAGFTRALDLSANADVNLQGAITWAFEYEDGIGSVFDGFRVLSTEGIIKPVFNAHRMLSKLTGQRVQATSSGQVALDTAVADGVRNQSDVGVIASVDGEPGSERVAIFVWHYHDAGLPRPDAEISVSMTGLPFEDGAVGMTHYRLDNGHSNSYSAWLNMGSPPDPSPEQYDELKKAGDLATLGGSTDSVQISGGKATMSFSLPIHGLSLIVLERS